MQLQRGTRTDRQAARCNFAAKAPSKLIAKWQDRFLFALSFRNGNSRNARCNDLFIFFGFDAAGAVDERAARLQQWNDRAQDRAVARPASGEIIAA